jgi:epoxide hydrolase-like predicted phosphatase
MPVKAIIFDLGGVMLRTADFSPREKLAAQLGMSRSALEQLVFGGELGGWVQKGEISLEEHWNKVRQQLDCSPEEFKDLIKAFFAEDKLDEDLVDYIRVLHRQYKTALLSNATADLRQQIAEKWHFEDVFDALIISGEVGAVKPEPRIFQIALETLGVEAREAVFVDDMPGNVEGARNVGLQAIQFKTSQQIRHDIDEIINEPES